MSVEEDDLGQAQEEKFQAGMVVTADLGQQLETSQ
jgi:hypothetical protein